MAEFFEDLKSRYLFAPDEDTLMGLFKSTAVNAVSGLAGRYAYYKFIGTPLNNLVGKYFGKYANIGTSAIYSIVLNLIATKITDNQYYSNMIQIAGSVPLADYLAKALGDPLGPGILNSGTMTGNEDSVEANEEAEVKKLMGQAPQISMQSFKGY